MKGDLNPAALIQGISFLLLAGCSGLALASCRKNESQNMDIHVSGRVYDGSHNGIGNAVIYIKRGKPPAGIGGATFYDTYDSVRSDAGGAYGYLVKTENSMDYQACCATPPGFSGVVTECGEIELRIADSKTLPVTIDFELIP